MQLGGMGLAALAVGSITSVDTSSCSAASSTTSRSKALARTLILYDTRDSTYAYLGELHAVMAANLASHFGAWSTIPVADYMAGQMQQFTAVIYVGSIYDEPLPRTFLDDVLGGSVPVIWIYDNIWQLQSWIFSSTGIYFTDRYGWTPAGFDKGNVDRVSYKGRMLMRSPGTLGEPAPPLVRAAVDDPGKATVLASAVRSDGTMLPWAIRSGNLTYVSEIPFSGISEGDRILIYADLLFDALAPATPRRHRALVRLEDVGPDSDPTQLMAIARYLKTNKIPFAFGVYPRYRDPLGTHYAPGTEYSLVSRPAVVEAIRFMLDHDGTMIMHGWTHQYGDGGNAHIYNPYGGQSGDDAEFFYAHFQPPGPGVRPTDAQKSKSPLVWQGPVAEDSVTWASSRLSASAADFGRAHLPIPEIFEFPHYAASIADYHAVAARFGARYERSLYPKGLLTGGEPDYRQFARQFFPYVVRDIYGTKVIPENLGNYSPSSPAQSPSQIVANAERNLVVRDGFASFYYHPYFGPQALRQIIEGGLESSGASFGGILDLGYTFVSAASL